jgi:hypothetical protein
MSRNFTCPPTVYIVDFEAFKHGAEDYRLKELCIMDASRPMKQRHYTFMPTCRWEELSPEQKRTYSYLTRDLHRLSWNEGTERFCEECLKIDLRRFVSSNNIARSVFYVLGQAKVDYLKQLFPDFTFVNYQAAYGVTLRELPDAPSHVACTYRNHGKHCAFLKCVRVYLHFVSLYI